MVPQNVLRAGKEVSSTSTGEAGAERWVGIMDRPFKKRKHFFDLKREEEERTDTESSSVQTTSPPSTPLSTRNVIRIPVPREERERRDARDARAAEANLHSTHSLIQSIREKNEKEQREILVRSKADILSLVKKCSSSLTRCSTSLAQIGILDEAMEKEKARLKNILWRDVSKTGKHLKLDMQSFFCLNETQSRLLGKVISEMEYEKVSFFLGKDSLDERGSNVFFSCLNILIPVLMLKKGVKVYLICHELEKAKANYFIVLGMHLSNLNLSLCSRLLLFSLPTKARKRTSSPQERDLFWDELTPEGLYINLTSEGYHLHNNTISIVDKDKFTDPTSLSFGRLFCYQTPFSG